MVYLLKDYKLEALKGDGFGGSTLSYSVLLLLSMYQHQGVLNPKPYTLEPDELGALRHTLHGI